jgi:putative ABC transport system permease protein
VNTLLAMQNARAGFETRRVLAVDVPVLRDGQTPGQIVDYYREATREILRLPGVANVSVTDPVPWRDADSANNFVGMQFGVDGHVPAPGEHVPRAGVEVISPGYFATLGLPIIEGRDFQESDRNGSEPVVIISQTLANQLFPNGGALNHHLTLTDRLLAYAPKEAADALRASRRIIGIVPDIDNTNVIPRPTGTMYHPFDQEQMLGGGRLLVESRVDPYSLVQPITRIMHQLSALQPVEHAMTLDDIRAEVLSPERLNAVVSSVFAFGALLIAVVGVAGVLAFSVSGRTREFGIRLAVGSQPRNLLVKVIAEGAAMAVAGLAVGFGCGYWLAQLAGKFLGELQMPGVLPAVGSALVLLAAAVIASAIPAARAARVDIMQALRAE